MKKIFYAIVFLWTLLAACQEHEMNGFENEGSVYFQLDPRKWSNMTDSLVYSFAGKEETETTLYLQVNLMGEATDRNREIRLAIDKEHTTAEEGVHYKPFPASYTLPAHAYSIQIPVTMIGTDPRMENQFFQLALKLEASDNLGLGLTKRTRVRISVSSMLSKPSYWSDAYWGAYSKKKHECVIRELGMDFPTAEEYDKSWYTWMQAYPNYMSQYFENNYPIYDENGNPIEPWFKN